MGPEKLRRDTGHHAVYAFLRLKASRSMFRFFTILLFLFCETFRASARAVNISEKWFLPQEGFPFFYRYFKEKVTWDEARELCHSHNGDLISLKREEMDVLRAYLKELDVFTHVWIGLEKEMSHDSFKWISGELITGDGYWLEPAPKSSARLCAAVDPTADFRWVVFQCWGPETASFVCQQKVPEWANNEDGCMITELPSLSITLEPDIGVVELTSDCGLAGTRRIACKGRINREETIRRLSCDVDPFTDRSTTERGRENSAAHGGTTRTPHRDGTRPTTKGLSWTSTERLTRH